MQFYDDKKNKKKHSKGLTTAKKTKIKPIIYKFQFSTKKTKNAISKDPCLLERIKGTHKIVHFFQHWVKFRGNALKWWENRLKNIFFLKFWGRAP